MKINVQNKINNEILTFQDPLYYCFNSISSVEWVTAQGYSPTNEHLEIVADADSSCVKAFVEQPLITTNESVTLGMEKNVATVEVTLDCIIPTGLQGTVSIQCFDPDNAIARTVTTDGGGRRDNHGTIETTQPVRLFFNQQQGTLSRSYAYTISGGYAGDNYIVAAHPNFSVLGRAVIRQADSAAHTATAIAVPNSSASGGVSGSGGVASGGNVYGACKFLMTTKTLTVWRTLWIERDQMILTLPTGLEIIADEAPIDGLVEEQLGRACIQVREFLPNINVTVAGPEFVDLDNTQLDASSLDSLGFSNSFWSILLLSAFRSSDPEDVGACGGDHILLFNWTVNHACNVASMQQESDVTEVKRQVILHEIAHSFGLEHAPDEQRPDLMNPRLGVWEKLQEEYRTFTDVQLLSIQSFRVSADL